MDKKKKDKKDKKEKVAKEKKEKKEKKKSHIKAPVSHPMGQKILKMQIIHLSHGI